MLLTLDKRQGDERKEQFFQSHILKGGTLTSLDTTDLTGKPPLVHNFPSSDSCPPFHTQSPVCGHLDLQGEKYK